MNEFDAERERISRVYREEEGKDKRVKSLYLRDCLEYFIGSFFLGIVGFESFVASIANW